MTPLNDDYGVLFARGDYVGVDPVALRGVADPSLFNFADGALGVIATRVDMEGKPDPAATATVIFRSDPARLAEFEELGTLDLRSADGVARPRAVWDSATRRYLVSWTDRNAQPRWTTVADLARTEWQAAKWQPDNGGRRRRIVSPGNVGDARIGAVVTTADDTLAISGEAATALTRRFGRVVNTSATVTPQKIAAGSSANLDSVGVTSGSPAIQYHCDHDR